MARPIIMFVVLDRFRGRDWEFFNVHPNEKMASTTAKMINNHAKTITKQGRPFRQATVVKVKIPRPGIKEMK